MAEKTQKKEPGPDTFPVFVRLLTGTELIVHVGLMDAVMEIRQVITDGLEGWYATSFRLVVDLNEPTGEPPEHYKGDPEVIKEAYKAQMQQLQAEAEAAGEPPPNPKDDFVPRGEQVDYDDSNVIVLDDYCEVRRQPHIVPFAILKMRFAKYDEKAIRGHVSRLVELVNSPMSEMFLVSFLTVVQRPTNTKKSYPSFLHLLPGTTATERPEPADPSSNTTSADSTYAMDVDGDLVSFPYRKLTCGQMCHSAPPELPCAVDYERSEAPQNQTNKKPKNKTSSATTNNNTTSLLLPPTNPTVRPSEADLKILLDPTTTCPIGYLRAYLEAAGCNSYFRSPYKALQYSGFNPPPQHRRLQGDLAYIEYTSFEGKLLNITATTTGFYVNQTSDHNKLKFDRHPQYAAKYQTLVGLLFAIDSVFAKIVTYIVRVRCYSHPLDAFHFPPHGTKPWLAVTRETATHKFDYFKSQTEGICTYLPSERYNQSDNRSPCREWNEEAQGCKDLPNTSMEERLVRERSIAKVHTDFVEAAVQGCMAVVNRQLAPINPMDEESQHVFLCNNIFFSYAVDARGMYTHIGGNKVAHTLVKHDLNGLRILQEHDIPGLALIDTVIVDYKGRRVVAQCILPGILHGDQDSKHMYGAMDNIDCIKWDKDFHEVFLKVAEVLNLRPHKVHTPEGVLDMAIPIDCKGLRGSDNRVYVLELTRLTPRDSNFKERPTAVFRHELVQQFLKWYNTPPAPVEAEDEENKKDSDNKKAVQRLPSLYQHVLPQLRSSKDVTGVALQMAQLMKQRLGPQAVAALGSSAAAALGSGKMKDIAALGESFQAAMATAHPANVEEEDPNAPSTATTTTTQPPTVVTSPGGHLEENGVLENSPTTDSVGMHLEAPPPTPNTARSPTSTHPPSAPFNNTDEGGEQEANGTTSKTTESTSKQQQPPPPDSATKKVQFTDNAVSKSEGDSTSSTQPNPILFNTDLWSYNCSTDNPEAPKDTTDQQVKWSLVDNPEQLQKDEENIKLVSQYLYSSALPNLVSKLCAVTTESEPGAAPIETLTVTERFHQEGINMRYLGKVTTMVELEFVKCILQQEMIARVCKHKLREIMALCLQQGEELMAFSVASFFNAVFVTRRDRSVEEEEEKKDSKDDEKKHNASKGGSPKKEQQQQQQQQQQQSKGKGKKGKKGHKEANSVSKETTIAEADDILLDFVDDEIDEKSSGLATLIEQLVDAPSCLDNIVKEIEEKYQYTLPDWKAAGWWPQLSKLAILRAVCLKTGVRILAREYDFTKGVIFQESDIHEVTPKVHQVIPKCTDAKKMLEDGVQNLVEYEWEHAYHNLQCALAFFTQVQGPLSVSSITCYSLLSNVMYSVGDMESALLFQHKALTVSNRILGADHPTTAQLHQAHGLLCNSLDNTSSAIKHLQRCYYLKSIMCGVDHPDTAVALANLGMVQQEASSSADAVENLHKALDISERTAGPNSLQYAGCCYAISMAYSATHDYSSAVKYQRKVYDAHQAVYGADDLLTQEADTRLKLLLHSAVTAKKVKEAFDDALKKGGGGGKRGKQ